MFFKFALMLVLAYFVGSIPTAYLIARWRKGIDIRQYGSGNVGASNVMATVSRRWSVFVTIFDIAKGAGMVWAAQLLGLSVAQQAVTGLAAVAGHNWTVFLRFQGGRGIFTSLGVIFMMAPRVGVFALVFPYLFFAPFKLLPLGVTIALILLPLISWLLRVPFGVGEPLPVALCFLGIFLIAMVRRFTAPRTPISASTPTGELLLNRLLFDRDIKDREAWINQTRPEVKPAK
jgi:acyl phosphate:glycerol-3-phosphate acyltransferase